MGKPKTRLNPKVESAVQRFLLREATDILIFFAFLLPERTEVKRGVKPYDYRKMLVLCILRVLLKKTYADYEIEMRTDKRICDALEWRILPGKSTIQRAMDCLKMETLREFNTAMLKEWTNRKLNVLIDASGIRILGRSIWYSLRIKKHISRRECDKVHLATDRDVMFILNWFITDGKRNDSPYFKKLLKPFKWLGIVIADAGYLARKNFQFVADKGGSAFIPFQKRCVPQPKGCPAWKHAFNLWKYFNSIFRGIYHQRSKVEAVFSVLKKKWGDQLHSKKAYIRRREMALRFISYNVKLVVCLRYATKHNLPLWVRAN